MSEELFRVVLTEALTGEFDQSMANRRFAKAFKLDRKPVDVLAQNGEQVIKNNVSESLAMNFMIKVLECGYECYVQEMPEEGLNYEEKPRGGEQRLRFQRGPRPGAILPDRRLKIRRKREDRIFLEMLRPSRRCPYHLRPIPISSKSNLRSSWTNSFA
jgi:hypothetical protein